jgi:hypothetical protein
MHSPTTVAFDGKPSIFVPRDFMMRLILFANGAVLYDTWQFAELYRWVRLLASGSVYPVLVQFEKILASNLNRTGN